MCGERHHMRVHVMSPAHVSSRVEMLVVVILLSVAYIFYYVLAVSAAAACATLDVIADEGLLQNATDRGAQLQAGLRDIASRHSGVISDVRGRGCMIGLEFSSSMGAGFAGNVTAACLDHGLLLLTTVSGVGCSRHFTTSRCTRPHTCFHSWASHLDCCRVGARLFDSFHRLL